MESQQFVLTAPRLQVRSFGLKLIIICGLALLMGIPAIFVGVLIADRTGRAQDVVKEIAGTVGGQQTFLGPVLAVPYETAGDDKKQKWDVEVIYPERGDAKVKTATEVRHRSLFKVPVYQSELQFESSFDLTAALGRFPKGAVPDWSRAELIVGASDARGALADATVTTAAGSQTLAPASNLNCVRFDAEKGRSLCFFGARAALSDTALGKFDARASMRFSGAQRVAVLAFAKTTNIEITGDWQNPSFDGGFSPVKRDISAQGFDAKWSVPFIARGVQEQGGADSLERLGNTEMGVSFVELADPYQSVNRAVKYVLLFVGLVFLTFFIFEVTTGRRVHPAQYLLVGVAQIIFYLLLLSIAERSSFNLGFAIAAVATVGLISLYAKWVFESNRQGVRALAVFSILYGLIYVLLRLEDQALLVGALSSFIAIAAVMYFTRRIDWYASSQAAEAPVRAT